MGQVTSVALFAALSIAMPASCVAEGGATKQGWSKSDRDGWYRGTQGSRLLPVAWFDALEQADSVEMFSDPAFLSSFGYLSSEPEKYPIGFAIDRQPDDDLNVTKLRWYQGQKGGGSAEDWVGMNCSACHTGQITYRGTNFRIDGGPGLTDFQSFVESLDASLATTRKDPAKWDRFSGRVLKGKDNSTNRTMLAAEFDKILDWQNRTEQLNHTSLRYGAGRVDAFGHIFNKIVLFAGAQKSVSNPSDAPVSFPFLWNIHRQSHVQWNGIAENSKIRLLADNFDYGAIGRNTGEVLGVFGEVVISPQKGLFGSFAGYPSSVNIESLEGLETLVERLQPAAWPKEFPQINRELANQGGVLFEKDCGGCHKPVSQLNETETMHRFAKMSKSDVTDIWMACNALTYSMDRTRLTDRTTKPEDRVALAAALSEAVKGALVGRIGELIGIATTKIYGGETRPIVFDRFPRTTLDPTGREQRRRFCLGTDDAMLAYKARPLDGIWATAPYLHNGSVPTLFDLLLPAKDRPRHFRTGNREYDPVRIGYVTEDSKTGFLFSTVDGDGRTIDGNSNFGHEYGAGKFTDADRWALVEYLKTL